MKFILLLLVFSTQIFAQDLTSQEVVSLLKSKSDVLSKLELGMSKQTVQTGEETMIVSSPDGYDEKITCKMKYTNNISVVAIFSKQYYVHTKTKSESIDNDPRCDEDNKSEEDKKNLTATNITLVKESDFSWIIENFKSARLAGDILYLELQFDEGQKFHFANSSFSEMNYELNINEPIFYGPKLTKFTTSDHSYSYETTTEKKERAKPSDFDLTKIEACVDVETGLGLFRPLCEKEADFSEILEEAK